MRGPFTFTEVEAYDTFGVVVTLISKHHKVPQVDGAVAHLHCLIIPASVQKNNISRLDCSQLNCNQHKTLNWGIHFREDLCSKVVSRFCFY